MKIENLRISLRERNPWQAIDMGFNIARAFYPTLVKSYLLGFSLVSIPVIFLLFKYPFWASLVIWYLKPLFETGPQVLLSRKIFDENFSNKQIFSITLQSIKKNIFHALVPLRFTIKRSFLMPLFLLENLPKKLRKKRLKTFQMGQYKGPTSLTILLAHAELLFYLVILFSIYQFIPEFERVNLNVLWQQQQSHLALEWTSIFCWFITIVLIAPFYISSGFALYLNKRIELEGWDIELSFKRIKNRLKKLSTVASCILLTFFLIHTPSKSFAAEKPELSKTSESKIQSPEKNKMNIKIHEEIEKIMQNEPLVYKSSGSQWKFKHKDQDPGSSLNLIWFAGFFEIILWAAVIVLILWLLLKIPAVAKMRVSQSTTEKIIRHADVFGMKLSEQDLNINLSDAITRALAQNDLRKAMALMLSSSLGELALKRNRNIPKGATENDCLNLAQNMQLKKNWLNWFERLLHFWSMLAWGHKNISKMQVETLFRQAPLEELSQQNTGFSND